MTRVYCDELAKAAITRKYRNVLALSLKLGLGGFQLPSRRYISETVQDRAYVSVNH